MNQCRQKYRLFKARLKIKLITMKLEWSHRIGLKKGCDHHGLDAPLVISLTSYPKRYATLHLTLYTLLNQSTKADEIILWVAVEDFKTLPRKVKELDGKGVSIKMTEDILSYKKIIPTLKAFPKAYIITVDDDLCYPENLIKKLVQGAKKYPGYAIANRSHLVVLDENRKIKPYQEWKHLKWDNSAPEYNFLTGAGGVLYPPNIFYKDILDQATFMELVPRADDVWLYWMLRLNSKSVINSGYEVPTLSWPGSQDSALWRTNVYESGNDQQVAKMTEKFGLPF